MLYELYFQRGISNIDSTTKTGTLIHMRIASPNAMSFNALPVYQSRYSFYVVIFKVFTKINLFYD